MRGGAAAHFVQFWDGRAKDVEEQAQGPVLNPVEMAMPAAPKVEATLRDALSEKLGKTLPYTWDKATPMG